MCPSPVASESLRCRRIPAHARTKFRCSWPMRTRSLSSHSRNTLIDATFWLIRATAQERKAILDLLDLRLQPITIKSAVAELPARHH